MRQPVVRPNCKNTPLTKQNNDQCQGYKIKSDQYKDNWRQKGHQAQMEKMSKALFWANFIPEPPIASE